MFSTKDVEILVVTITGRWTTQVATNLTRIFSDELKKPWLFRLFRGLSYPLLWVYYIPVWESLLTNQYNGKQEVFFRGSFVVWGFEWYALCTCLAGFGPNGIEIKTHVMETQTQDENKQEIDQHLFDPHQKDVKNEPKSLKACKRFLIKKS